MYPEGSHPFASPCPPQGTQDHMHLFARGMMQILRNRTDVSRYQALPNPARGWHQENIVIFGAAT